MAVSANQLKALAVNVGWRTAYNASLIGFNARTPAQRVKRARVSRNGAWSTRNRFLAVYFKSTHCPTTRKSGWKSGIAVHTVLRS